jgi:hypothetical protein
MKMKSFALALVCSTLLTLSTTFVWSQTVVTFDELTDSTTGTFIPTGYEGLSWSNFSYLTPFLMTNVSGLTGYYYGMVSLSNVAFNAGGTPAEINSATNFNFLSAYLTGAWNSNLNIQVEGFNGTNLLYNQTVVASATDATLFTFNYLDIDRLYFDSFGGEPAFGGTARENLVMDNMTFEFIPEPSSLLLTALGAAILCAVIRPRRFRRNTA